MRERERGREEEANFDKNSKHLTTVTAMEERTAGVLVQQSSTTHTHTHTHTKGKCILSPQAL